MRNTPIEQAFFFSAAFPMHNSLKDAFAQRVAAAGLTPTATHGESAIRPPVLYSEGNLTKILTDLWSYHPHSALLACLYSQKGKASKTPIATML